MSANSHPGESASDLEDAILSAYAAEDQVELIRLYRRAADIAEAENDIDQAAFFLTYAWIYALELGHEDATKLCQRLADWGRVT